MIYPLIFIVTHMAIKKKWQYNWNEKKLYEEKNVPGEQN
jgi:hypothetical protein